MSLSQFNLYIPSPSGDGIVVANTLTNAAVLMEEDFLIRLRSFAQGLSQSVDTDIHDALPVLLENGIYVHSRAEEKLKARARFLHQRKSTEELSLALMTTYACNFQCRYCYQARKVKPKTMDAETLQAFMLWAEMRIERIRPKKIRLDFYGGEPLITPRLLLDAAGRFHDLSQKYDLELEMGIITNGSLIDSNLIAELAGLGLKWIKVTLDGNRESHNHYRRAKSGEGSYDLILSNIERVASLVDVRLSGNFDAENLAAFQKHLEYLHSIKLQNKIQSLSIRPIIKNEDEEGYDDSCSGQCAYQGIPAREYLELRNFARDLGFPVFDTTALGPCEAVVENAYNIDPYGDIYKCAAFVGDPSQVVGNVKYSDAPLRDEVYLKAEPFRECTDCVFLPICYGSCRYVAIKQGGDMNTPLCDKEYFEKVVKPILAIRALEESGVECATTHQPAKGESHESIEDCR